MKLDESLKLLSLNKTETNIIATLDKIVIDKDYAKTKYQVHVKQALTMKDSHYKEILEEKIDAWQAVINFFEFIESVDFLSLKYKESKVYTESGYYFWDRSKPLDNLLTENWVELSLMALRETIYNLETALKNITSENMKRITKIKINHYKTVEENMTDI